MHSSNHVPVQLPLRPGEDLIDVTYDEPVDPFSGLIGMPPSIVGCEAGDVFGFPSISSSCSSGGGGDIDNNSSIRTDGGSYSGRPPSGKRTPKRGIIVETFDPLLEGEECGNAGDGLVEASSSSFSGLSSFRPSATPPRHYKDDPLLANSRYRPPAMMMMMMMQSPTSSSGLSHQKQRPSLTHRSLSLGSAGLNVNTSLDCNTCILGTIAQLEVNTPRGGSSMKDGKVDHGRSSSAAAAAVVRFSSSSRSLNGTTDEKSSRTTHTTVPLDKSHDEKDYDDDEDDDDGSCRSFTEEYHRREQKHKGVVREVKHILGLGAVGKKLFRRGSEGTKLRRADGCLT